MPRRKKTTPNKPFDATTKALIEINPHDWLEFFGFTATEYELISGDLSTVTTDADRLIHIKKPKECAVHQEIQSSAERRFPDRLLRYNVLAEDKLHIPVHTVAILLRLSVDPKGRVTGLLERKDENGEVYLTFRYHVVRVWEIPVDTLFAGGAALLPLALISDLSGKTPEMIVRQMEARLIEENVPQETQSLLMTSAFVLAGLTYHAEDIERLFRGVRQMKESSTYQLILEEGRKEVRAQEAQNMLLLIGKGRLGVPDMQIIERVRAISSVETLEAMAERLLAVESWAELLGQGEENTDADR